MSDRKTISESTANDKATCVPTQLIDMVGQTIEILGRTFTVDWIDAPKSEDNGKVMVQSDETEIYHIGDRYEAVADVMSEISSELMKGKGAKE